MFFFLCVSNKHQVNTNICVQIFYQNKALYISKKYDGEDYKAGTLGNLDIIGTGTHVVKDVTCGLYACLVNTVP